jgi:hypothetical protein
MLAASLTPTILLCSAAMSRHALALVVCMSAHGTHLVCCYCLMLSVALIVTAVTLPMSCMLQCEGFLNLLCYCPGPDLCVWQLSQVRLNPTLGRMPCTYRLQALHNNNIPHKHIIVLHVICGPTGLSSRRLSDTCGVLVPLLLFRPAVSAGKSLSPCCSCLWSMHMTSAVSGSCGILGLQEGLPSLPAAPSFILPSPAQASLFR